MPAVGKHYIPSYTIQKFPWDANFHTFQWHGPSPKSPQEVGRINYVPITAVQRFDMEKNFIRNGASRHCREDGGINSVWNRRPQDGRIGAKTSITITWTNQNLIVWFVWLSSWPICAAAISESMSSQTMTLKNPKVLVFGAGGKNSPQVSSFGMIWYLQPSRFLAARYTWAPSPWNLRAASAGSRIRGDWNLISRSGAKSIDWSPIGSNKNLAQILGINSW